MFSFKRVWVILIAVGLLLTACGGQRATEVQITLTEFGIKSSMTEFQSGVPYHFVVKNEGAVEHEIMLMPPLTQDQMGMNMDMGAMDKMALAMIDAADMQPGKTSSFDYTFAEPAPAGTIEFACHTSNHYQEGMQLPITVK